MKYWMRWDKHKYCFTRLQVKMNTKSWMRCKERIFTRIP